MLKFQLFWDSFRHAFSKEQFLKEIEADIRCDWQWEHIVNLAHKSMMTSSKCLEHNFFELFSHIFLEVNIIPRNQKTFLTNLTASL